MIDVKELAGVVGPHAADRTSTIISKRVTVIRDKKKETRLLWGNTTSLTVFQEKKKKKTPVVVASHLWMTLEKLTVTPNNTIILNFAGAKPLEFTHPDLGLVAMNIRSHLFSFMRQKEIPEFSLPSSLQTSRTVPGNGFARLLNLLAMKKTGLSIETSTRYSKFFAKKPKELHLSFFEQISNYYPELLDSLFLEESIVRLIVDVELNDTIIKIIAQFLEKNVTVSDVIFSGNLVGSLQPLTQNPLNVRKFGFIKSELNEKNADIVRILFEHNISVRALEFVGCMDRLVASKSFSGFPVTSRLLELSISKIYGIPIEQVVTMATHVGKLSLSNCRIDITEVLEKLHQLKSIEYLDLSSNVALLSPPTTCVIPKSLRTLVLDDVQFSSKTLIQFFECLGNLASPLRLFMRDIGMSDSWDQFFIQCDNIDCVQIDGLMWDKNHFDDHFARFLGRIPCLACLSLSGCLDRDPSIIPHVETLLENTRSVKALDLSCNSFSPEISQIGHFFDVLAQNSSLSRLRIAGFQLENLDLLTKCLLENTKIGHLSYDFKGIPTTAVIEMLEKLSKRGLTLPGGDIHSILASADKDQKARIDSLVRNLAEIHRRSRQGSVRGGSYEEAVTVRKTRKMSYDCSALSREFEPRAPEAPGVESRRSPAPIPPTRDDRQSDAPVCSLSGLSQTQRVKRNADNLGGSGDGRVWGQKTLNQSSSFQDIPRAALVQPKSPVNSPVGGNMVRVSPMNLASLMGAPPSPVGMPVPAVKIAPEPEDNEWPVEVDPLRLPPTDTLFEAFKQRYNVQQFVTLIRKHS